MRALRIHGYGGPEVMRIEEVEKPLEKKDYFLLKIRAASVNPVDWKMRNGVMAKIFPLTFPRILGRDCAGETADGTLVAGVSDPRIDGTHAEYALLDEKNLTQVPEGLSAPEAASLCVAGLSAYIPLVEVMSLQKGQNILIHAGAGGVGSLAIQIARHLGAEVTATASESNKDFCFTLGAAKVIDYQKESPQSNAFDAVLDTIGGGTHIRSMDYLKPGGVLVALSAAPVPPVQPREAIRVVMAQIQPSAERLAKIFQWARDGVLRPQVTRTFPLDEAAAAYAVSESGHGRGKTVILP
ncbi:MAG TPA: NADP-dependent oxidoreductase [Burkholderiales bacterium]